jgi:DNA-binding NarL/FixJ family response regulator
VGYMDEATPARILIADDHALVREGLRTMLSGEVVAEANDGRQALDTCRELKSDLVLMDVRMPVMDGLQATRKIKQEMPKTSVMMVTMHENPDYLFEAVKAGAAGYVLKDASGERLLSAVRRTLEGESPLNQELAMQLLVRLARESSYSSEEEIGGGSGERSGRPSPGASGTTPVRGSEEDGEPLASHPVATDPTQRPVCCKGGCDTSYPFAFDPNHRVTESERAFDLPIPKIGNAGWMRSRRTLQSCCY